MLNKLAFSMGLPLGPLEVPPLGCLFDIKVPRSAQIATLCSWICPG